MLDAHGPRASSHQTAWFAAAPSAARDDERCADATHTVTCTSPSAFARLVA